MKLSQEQMKIEVIKNIIENNIRKSKELEKEFYKLNN
jgi:hypothetical protein